ncbi:MAG: hypothetical protein AB7D92_02070 [Sphaerochaeta sp.]
MKQHRTATILTILLIAASSSLSAGQSITTPHFTFTVPETMEIQVTDLQRVFALQAQPKDSYTYTIQPKGASTLKQKLLPAKNNTITLKAEHVNQERTNAAFRDQSKAFTQEEFLQASQVFEQATRRAEPVRVWYPLTTTEIDGMFAWKYAYETLTGIHSEVYIIHAGDTLISLSLRYTKEEKSNWEPVYQDFLSSGIAFLDTLKPPKEDQSTTSAQPETLQRYPIFGSEETFLWTSSPDWKASAVYLPGQGGTKVHTIKTQADTLQTDGYYCKITAIEGIKAILSSSISRQNYLLQSKKDIERQLENNANLKNRTVVKNEIDYATQSYVITYTYNHPYGEEVIHGAMVVKITKERIMLQVEVEWFDRGEELAAAIIDSIINE